MPENVRLRASSGVDVRLGRNSVWLRDGEMWSSAGVSAGVDLTLAMIEEDHSVAVALQVARMLVVFLKRPGGQSSPAAAKASHSGSRYWH